MSDRSSLLVAIAHMYAGALVATLSFTGLGFRSPIPITGDPWLDAFVLAVLGTLIGIAVSIGLSVGAVAYLRWRYSHFTELDVDVEDLRRGSP